MATVVSTVHFGDGIVEIVFMEVPGDVRAEGTVMLTRTLLIDVNKGDYEDGVEDLHRAALALLNDALEDWTQGGPTLTTMEGR